jgi:nucleotide sugar dehydrogenase
MENRSEVGVTHKALQKLLGLVRSRGTSIGVFGAGYVGLPLACAFAEAGFRTVACDSDRDKVIAIRDGEVYIEDDYVRKILPALVESKVLTSSDDVRHVASMVDFAIVTVPTPLDDSGEPDLSYVTSVTRDIAEENRPGKFLILESSVFPGTTEEIVKPILEERGLRAGFDFGLAYSPERIDYGNSRFGFRDIPKIVGGITPICTQIASELYSRILRARIVQMSSTRAAEATKMLENVYRFVNIALVNELAILHERLGIDFFEVIAGASTKPFGFQPFYPGPGVGGHCIPKDPHYLSYKARQVGLSLKLVEASQHINQGMIDHVIARLENHLREKGRTLRQSKAVILGLAFKADVSDTRNSPSITLAEGLKNHRARVSAYDPFAKRVSTRNGIVVSTSDLETAVRGGDILFLVTPHTLFKSVDLTKLHAMTHPDAVMVDTRGFWSPSDCIYAGFDYLCLGRPFQNASNYRNPTQDT